jgi:cytochrome c peroxidase
VEILGKLLNFDLNMSLFRNEACGFCHMPYVAFSGPIPSVNLTMIGYPGTLHYRAGKRTSVHEYDATQGAFFGGNFWDARSTGCKAPMPSRRSTRRSIPGNGFSRHGLHLVSAIESSVPAPV